MKPFVYGSDTMKSPKVGASLDNEEVNRTPTSSPSPLLLPSSEFTPVPSRDEEAVIFSDSDGGSQYSGMAIPMSSEHKNENRGRVTNRRRRSDSSEQSSRRSFRSTSAQREKIPQTTKIFRNLLILEESLRQQSKDQRVLRRKFTSFLAILAGLEVSTIYSLYFTNSPPTGFIKIVLQFLFLSILVTLTLFNLSGEYRRTIIIPRKFFTSTNKGLRQLNLRLVKVKAPISDTFIDYWRTIIRSIVAIWLYLLTPIAKLPLTVWLTKKLKELERSAQPRIGATDVKLVLNPRAFNSSIREDWELYRDEFWAREGAKRRHTKEEVEPAKNVLHKTQLVEKHRQQRRERRRSKIGQDAAAVTTAVSTATERQEQPSPTK